MLFRGKYINFAVANLIIAMKQLLTALTFIICLAIQTNAAQTPLKLSSATDSLKTTLKLRKSRMSQRLARIDSLKSELAAEASPSAEKLSKIAGAYNGLNVDSALFYYNQAWRKAEADGNLKLRNLILINYAEQLPKIALFSEAIATLDSICPDSLDLAGKKLFYSVRSHIYIDAIRYHPLAFRKEDNTARAIADLDTLGVLFNEKSLAKRLTQAQSHFLKGQETMALGELNEVFDNLSPNDPTYAIIAGMLASFYSDKPDKTDEYLYYLTISATADALNANGEEASLMLLGSELFRMGDTDQAFEYLTASSEALKESGARMLISEIAPPMSIFAETMRTREESHNLWIIILSVIMIAIAAASGWLIWHGRRVSSSRAAANQKLTASISMRDQYISQLLEICSVYVEGLEDFNRLVGRKLKANQIQDLLKMIESGKMMQDQTERFFEVFDTAVFNIFPNFLGDVNAFLLPDKQMAIPEPGKLSPELRIVAFMRLGVTDSNRLSKFLGLSLNTVYTYRNRLKGRASERDKFEENIQNLGKNA